MKKSYVQRNKKGFTLIELIVVIAILAILAAIAIPNFIGMTRRANNATEVAAASELANAINIHNTLAAGDSTIAAITAVPANQAAFETALGNLWPTFDANYANVVFRLAFTVSTDSTSSICRVDPAKKGDITIPATP